LVAPPFVVSYDEFICPAASLTASLLALFSHCRETCQSEANKLPPAVDFPACQAEYAARICSETFAGTCVLQQGVNANIISD
jgi:hypothetical protein